MKHHVLIGLTHGVANELVANHALIDEEILHIGLTTIKSRQCHPATQMQGFLIDVNFHQAFGKGLAAYSRQPAAMVFEPVVVICRARF